LVGKFFDNKIMNVSFTFNEAVNGCSKTISYDRLVKCNKCNLDSVNCKNCNDTKSVPVREFKTVNFKGPIFDKDKIRFVGFGNFIPIKSYSNPPKDRYADLLIYAEVEKSNLTINRGTGNIESSVNVSLVDALGGGSVDVETIKNNVSVKVPPKTKNGTKLKLGGYGPNNKDHIITINVDYPEGDELDSLISFLKKE
jgi:DnaJ-class molecular chaperone